MENFYQVLVEISRKGYITIGENRMKKAKKATKVSFADVQGRILELVAQSKRFSGFDMPESLKDEIRRCAMLLREGHEGEAARLGLLVERGFTKLLQKYFRNSERHFDRRIRQRNPDHYDQDVWDKLLADYRNHYLPEVRRQDEMSVQHCADVHSFMESVLAWVDGEQKRREHNGQVLLEQQQAERLKQKALAEESRKAEQRRLAFEQRYAAANQLLAAIP